MASKIIHPFQGWEGWRGSLTIDYRPQDFKGTKDIRDAKDKKDGKDKRTKGREDERTERTRGWGEIFRPNVSE
jgi:hypothetical protein